jgi:hypothetical protein
MSQAAVDAVKAIADLQKVALDIVALAKGGVGLGMFAGILDAVSDAGPLVGDFAKLAPEISQLQISIENISDYQAISTAALGLIFAVAKAAVA